MSKIMELLSSEDSVVFFDIDGVLSPYEYGEYNHNACRDEDWDAYILNSNVYENVRPVRLLQDFINKKGKNNIFAVSVANDYEAAQKKDFVVDKYGIRRS